MQVGAVAAVVDVGVGVVADADAVVVGVATVCPVCVN